MELKRASIVLILVVMYFGGMVSSLCLVRNTSAPKVYLYQCFMSSDYLTDVKKAPIDINWLTFTNSKMKVIKDGSFTRLNQNLERLAFFHCDVEEIEDNAFRGLAKLYLLTFRGNKLQIIKSAWFAGLSNLKSVSFTSNKIKHVEDNFFSILPPLKLLDISDNEITCLPTALFGNFHADEFYFWYNRLTWTCQAQLLNWLQDKKIEYDYQEIDNMDSPYDVTKMCVQKLPKSQLSENPLNNCIEKTVHEFLPATGNYTVKQVCKLLENKPSPFLNCTK